MLFVLTALVWSWQAYTQILHWNVKVWTFPDTETAVEEDKEKIDHLKLSKIVTKVACHPKMSWYFVTYTQLYHISY